MVLKKHLLLFGSMTALQVVGWGQQSSPMNLERMVKEAGIIFAGKVVHVATGAKYSRMKLYATDYTFHVTDPVYGVREDTLKIKQYGGEADGRKFYPPGVARFEEGEEVIVLLYPPSNVGMTSTVGKDQGKFLIRRIDSTGQKTVANKLENRGLFDKMRYRDQVADQSWLNGKIYGPVLYEKFVETLRELVQVLKR